MKEKRQGLVHLMQGIPIIIALVFLAGGAGAAEKDKYPAKPITMIVPYVAGSGLDIEVRGIQPFLQKHLGVPLVIANMPGADGRLGLTKAFKAPNDGYTILSPGWPAPVVGELMFKPDYRSLEFAFIGAWTESNYVVVVHADNWKTMAELVKAGKEKTLNCGLAGLSSVARVLGEALADVAGIKLNWIPFGGGGEYMAQLAGKHIDLAIASTSSVQSMVRAGRVRALMVIGNEKDSVFPQIPLGKEAGYPVPALPNTRSIVAPPGTSPAKVRIIEQALIKSVNEPAFQKWIKDRGMDITLRNHEQFRKDAEENFNTIKKYISRMTIKN